MALDNDNTWLYLGDSLVVQSSRSGEAPSDVTSGTLFFSSHDLPDDVEVRIFCIPTFIGGRNLACNIILGTINNIGT